MEKETIMALNFVLSRIGFFVSFENILREIEKMSPDETRVFKYDPLDHRIANICSSAEKKITCSYNKKNKTVKIRVR